MLFKYLIPGEFLSADRQWGSLQRRASTRVQRLQEKSSDVTPAWTSRHWESRFLLSSHVSVRPSYRWDLVIRESQYREVSRNFYWRFFLGLLKGRSSMFMLFFYFDPLQNHAIVKSWCLHYIFCWGGEVLPVKKKEEKGKGKWTNGLGMKNGRPNLCSFWAQQTVGVAYSNFCFCLLVPCPPYKTLFSQSILYLVSLFFIFRIVFIDTP